MCSFFFMCLSMFSMFSKFIFLVSFSTNANLRVPCAVVVVLGLRRLVFVRPFFLFVEFFLLCFRRRFGSSFFVSFVVFLNLLGSTLLSVVHWGKMNM